MAVHALPPLLKNRITYVVRIVMRGLRAECAVDGAVFDFKWLHDSRGAGGRNESLKAGCDKSWMQWILAGAGAGL